LTNIPKYAIIKAQKQKGIDTMNAKIISAAMARAISDNFEGYVDGELITTVMDKLYSQACAHTERYVLVKRDKIKNGAIFNSFFRGLGYTVKNYGADLLSISW
jgi:hypothetical protein